MNERNFLKYPKAILFSLFFVFFSAKCSKKDEKPYVKQQALLCKISYDNTEFNALRENALNSTCGSTNNICLSYNEKTERGTVYFNNDNDNPLQRLHIPKATFSELAKITKNDSSIDQLTYNEQHLLTSPLFIDIQDGNKHLLYKICILKKIKRSKLEEAEEPSGEEIKKNAFITGAALGFGGGLVVGGMAITLIVFFATLKKLFFACIS